jgi:hypothetical protein
MENETPVVDTRMLYKMVSWDQIVSSGGLSSNEVC